MSFRKQRAWSVAAAVVLVFSGCDKPTSDSASQWSEADQEMLESEGEENGGGTPFDDAEVFFEFNTTANDMGFQLFLDAEGWNRLKVAAPGNNPILSILAQGNLSRLGITELRFESAEPEPAEVLAMFPAGEYVFRGRSVDGERLFSRAELSHDFIPAFTFSPANGQVVDPNNTVVQWNIPDAERVEVIIESDEVDHVLDITVTGDVTSLSIPPQFLVSGTVFKIELLAIGENGNRTIVESTFVTQ